MERLALESPDVRGIQGLTTKGLTTKTIRVPVGRCDKPPEPTYQDTFLKSTHTLRAQKWVPKRIISRNAAAAVPFLAPLHGAPCPPAKQASRKDGAFLRSDRPSSAFALLRV